MASPASVSTLPTSVASQDDSAPTLKFTNIKALFQAIRRVSGDFLIVESRH